MAFFGKRLHSSSLVLDFLLWGVLSLIFTRLFLSLTNFMILGRGEWHVAHVLWGGLFMAAAILILLVFYSRKALRLSAVIAGIGWGLFIDEIGKFLTSDNNYWFRPAIIFIYLFILLFFAFYRFLEKNQHPSKSELWQDLLAHLQELFDHDLEVGEKRLIEDRLQKLQHFPPRHYEPELLAAISRLVNNSPCKSDRFTFDLPLFAKKSLSFSYRQFFKRKFVFVGLVIYSLWFTLDRIIDASRLLFHQNRLLLLQKYYQPLDIFSQTEVYLFTAKISLELIVALSFALGLYFWWRHRTLKALRFFQSGLLIIIFLDSFLRFYFEQFSAFFGLLLTIVVWYWLESYRREKLLLGQKTGKI